MGFRLRACTAAAAALLTVSACGGSEPAASDVESAAASATAAVSSAVDRDMTVRDAIEKTFIGKRLTDPEVVEGSYDGTTNSARVTADVGSCPGMTFDFANGEVGLPSFSTNTDAVQILTEQSRFAACGPVSAVLKLVPDPGSLDQPVDPDAPDEVRRAVAQVFTAKGFTAPQLVWSSYDPARNSGKVTAGVGVCNLTFDYDHARGAVGFPSFSADTNLADMLASDRFVMCGRAARAG